MTDRSQGEDPGWFSSKTLLWMFVPALAVRQAQQEDTNALALLRGLFTTFAAAIVLIGIVVLALATGRSSDDALPAGVVALAVSGYGIVSLFLPRVVERPLDCSAPQALLSSFRTRFFLRIAFAESAALVGFVGFFLAGEWWLYLLGALFAFVGFARLAPTRSNLERDQEQLNTTGCGESLISVLTTPAS